MGDKNQDRPVEAMEGIGSDQNPLKRRLTRKNAPADVAGAGAGAGAPGPSDAKKPQVAAKKATGAGDGSPADQKIGIDDLYAAIQAVGRTTKNLERVLEESVCNLNVVDKRLKRVEESSVRTCKIATDAQAGVKNLWKEIDSVRAEMAAAGTSRSTVNELRALRLNLERQEYYSRRFNLVFEGFPETEGETNGMLWNRFMQIVP